MTYPAGHKFDLEVECEEILQYLYWRRYNNAYVDLDAAQMELPFPFEVFEMATYKLKSDGLVELHPENNLLGRITLNGALFWRTESYIVNKKQSITLFLVTRRFTKGFQRHVRLEFVSTELSK